MSYFFPPKNHPPIIHSRRYARNGRIPEGAYIRTLTDAHNYTLGNRRKLLFSNLGDVQNIVSGSTGTTDRWSFRCHTGVGAASIRILMGMALDDSGSGADPSVQWHWTVSGGATTDLPAIRYGLNANSVVDTPNEWGWVEQVWTTADGFAADTTYEVTMDALDYGRPFVACVWEQSKTAFTNADSYFIGSQPSIGSRILDSYREDLATRGVSIWKSNAKHLWNWTKDVTAVTNATTTWKNAIDTSITTVSSASPGVSLVTTYDRRQSATTIPCVFAVRCHKTGTNNGEVRLQTASGTVASITGITAATPTWYSTTFNLTPGTTKHDLQFRASGTLTTVSLSAASVYEYEA